MHRVLRAAAAVLLALAVGGVAGSTQAAKAPAGPACGEACLKEWMDRYIAALEAHKPDSLPISKTVRITENGALISMGEGVWFSYTGTGKYRHDFYDPQTGGVSTYITMSENNAPGILTVRLKIAEGRITEIESIISRTNQQTRAMEAIAPSWFADWNSEEPAAKRLTREQLKAGVINYMRAVAWHDSKRTNFADDCMRIEVGRITAIARNEKNPPIPRPAPPANGGLDTLVGCAEQLDSLFMSFIQGFESAAFPVVDVKRQIVYGSFDFMRRGTVKAYVYQGKEYPIPAMARYPNEGVNGQAWKFKNGQIWRVESVFPGVQAWRGTTGWPGAKPELRPIDDTAGGRLVLGP